MSSDPEPDIDLVTVFETDDPGVLPLAELALREAQVEYVVRQAPVVPPVLREARTDFSNPANGNAIIVRAEDADRARDLLTDLRSVEPLAEAHKLDPTPAEWQAEGPPPIMLSDIDAGADVGRISEAQLQKIVDALEEDEETPGAYFITGPTIDVLQEGGLDPEIVAMLQTAIGDRESFLLRWQRLEE